MEYDAIHAVQRLVTRVDEGDDVQGYVYLSSYQTLSYLSTYQTIYLAPSFFVWRAGPTPNG